MPCPSHRRCYMPTLQRAAVYAHPLSIDPAWNAKMMLFRHLRLHFLLALVL